MSNNQSNNECKLSLLSLFLGFIILVFAMPFFFIYLDNYLEHYNYNEARCNITSVTYPDSYPTDNTSHLWTECDCGKYCTSLYPCIALYTDLSSNPIKKNFMEKDDFTSCTFTSNECNNGENPLEIINYVSQSIETAEQYINAELTCYIYNDESKNYPILLENDNNFENLILSAVFFGLALIMICVSGIILIKDEKIKDKKKSIIMNTTDEKNNISTTNIV